MAKDHPAARQWVSASMGAGIITVCFTLARTGFTGAVECTLAATDHAGTKGRDVCGESL